MIFNLIDIPRCERIDSPSGRLYKTPEGNLYPSVSTVLGATGDKEALEKWREAVGHETAEKISKRATDRGTLIHENVERWFRGEPESFTMFQHEERAMFRELIPFMKHCTEVYAMETPMWSDFSRAAGTPDFIGKVDGDITVVDWKTSGRYKTKNDIPHYFVQAAAYAQMFFERTGIPARRITIAMTTQDDGVILFKERVIDWYPEWMRIRKLYDDTRS